MKSSLILAAAVLLSFNWATGQSQNTGSATPSTEPAATKPISANATTFFILGEFSHSLNAKKLKAGDKVKAQVSQDVLSHGKILIPAGSKLEGHVCEANARSASDRQSRLGIVFDRVLLAHHREVDFQGAIQSLDAPAPRRSKVDEPDQMLPPLVTGVSQSSMGPMGSSSGPGRGASSGASSGMRPSLPAGAPLYVDGTPGSNAGNSSGGDLRHASSGKPPNPPAEATPMSVGMPHGVFGIKGLDLTAAPSDRTPGPVILSSTRDVKLEYGTQVLVRVTNPYVPKP